MHIHKYVYTRLRIRLTSTVHIHPTNTYVRRDISFDKLICLFSQVDMSLLAYTADPTWGDIFECCFKAQSSKLDDLFSMKRGERDVRTLSFELSKMSPQVGLAVYVRRDISTFQKRRIHIS